MKTAFILLFSLQLFFAKQLKSQDSLEYHLVIDSSYFFNGTVYSSGSYNYLLSATPDSTDSVIINTKMDLLEKLPNENNYYDYYLLANSLFNYGYLDSAENMLLRILNSKAKCLSGNYYHSSDIPGDTSTNTYGYGSYTSNYKNYASRLLAKINLRRGNGKKALRFTRLADKKYKVRYNCGTGNMFYRQELDGLYALSLSLLSRNSIIIRKYLPEFDGMVSDILIKAIKQKYSQKEIEYFLKVAENSIVFIKDTFETNITQISYDSENGLETSQEIKYISGKAMMKLFHKRVKLTCPILDNGDVATKEIFLKTFLNSHFYISLNSN